MKLLLVVIFIHLVGLGCHSHSLSMGTVSNEYMPFIVGMSLMVFVIIVLSASLIICFCIRRKTNDNDCKYGAISLETVKAVKYKVRNESINKEHIDVPLPKIYVNRNIDMPRQTISDFRGSMRFRRASVPTTLSSLEEAPSYMEEGSRRISLSYNCLTEPLDKKSKDSVIKTDEDKLYMSEYNFNTEKIENSTYVENKDQFMPRKFSVYDDESLSGDDYFSKFGKIYFSIQYDCDARTLSVTLLKGQHLIGHRIKGKNRFYVKLRLIMTDLQRGISTTSLSGLSPKELQKKGKINIRNGFTSSIKADFCNPVFEETFLFTNVTNDTLADCALQFVVKEETPKFLDKNQVIGFVDFILKNAELNTKHECITDIHRDLAPVGPIVNKGHAVLSLHYNRELAIISASLLELIIPDNELTAVTIEMYTRSIDNIIQKKKTSLENNLRSSDVVEFPMENCFLNSVCIVVVIFGRVRNCSKTPYGRFIVGPIRFTDGPGLTHWTEMTIGNQLSIRSHVIV